MKKNNRDVHTSLDRLYHSGQTLPRRSAEQVQTAVEEMSAARLLSGDRLLDSDDDHPLNKRIRSASDRWHQFRNTSSSRIKDVDNTSRLIAVGVLSKFALQPRIGMRLRDGASAEGRTGSAFKLPMSMLLGREDSPSERPSTGSVSIVVTEDAAGGILQIRLAASRDADFQKTILMEVVIEDGSLHQVVAGLGPDSRMFAVSPKALSGPAGNLHVKVRTIHAK
jgi:hypothetical protein